jgi:FkbM family methyltransferase
MLLVEPVPQQAQAAEQKLGSKVHQVAIGMNPGRRTMLYNNGSSYLKDTWAPSMTGQKEFDVDVVTFDTLDDGQIDIMNLDCEGQEWAVLSKMTSKPKLMSIEIDEYNPDRNLILQWLKDHDYALRVFNGPGQTQVWTKKGI